ncbi:MAG: hypothetical protein LBG17_00240 [Bacteroidales bacterium]|jgi:hypothetical protein|nr:hypothetical protein [Bacteroidales bacterium]
METPQQRLNKVLVHLKMDKSNLSKELGSHPMTLQSISNGRNKKITPKVAEKIVAKHPEINYEWLVTGTGNMLVNKGEVSNSIIGDGNGHRISPDNSDRWISLLENKDKQIDKLISLLEKAQNSK